MITHIGGMTGFLATEMHLACHIFGEPWPSVSIDVDADANAVQGRAEKVDAVPASEGFASHAFLNGVHAVPGCRIWSGAANIFAAITQAGEAFIGDALVRRAAIWAIVAEATMRHVPAMQERARGQGIVPGERRQPADGAIMVD